MLENFVANPADFKSAMELKDAIGRELANSKIKIDINSLGSIMDTDLDIMSIAGIVGQLDSSTEIQDAIFKCLIRCTYREEKITKDLFEDVSMRKHYYPMIWECIKVNLSPFYEGVRSELSKNPRIQGALATLQGQNAPESK